MESDFEAALARVRRANEHRCTLWELAAEHLADRPINQRFDVGEHEVRILASASARFPVQMSVIFGEWLHNLRSALDATLYELAVHDTGQNPPSQAGRRQFPVVTDPNSSEGRRSLVSLSRLSPHSWAPSCLGWISTCVVVSTARSTLMVTRTPTWVPIATNSSSEN